MNRRLSALLSFVAVLCAAILPPALAQTTATGSGGRFLLVFDTSSAMKTRVPSEQYAVERLFFSMMNGQLHPGDSIGVWTFNRKLRAGELPLQTWQPQNAALIASNITNFVGHQRYSRSTRFDAIMPDIDNLVQASERLTVLLFCDGEGEIKGTPYDNAINSVMGKNRGAFKNAKQTFIIVLRSQFGQYTGYTVNSSQTGVSFPEFPPLPRPPQPAAAVKANPPPQPPAPAPSPVVKLPPLVIVGTNVGTNFVPAGPPPAMIPTHKPVEPKTNPPPAEVKSNPAPVVDALTPPTNVASVKPAQIHTNAAASIPSPGNPTGLSRNGALAIGAALLFAAIVLIFSVLIRSRKANRGSLISSAMKKK